MSLSLTAGTTGLALGKRTVERLQLPTTCLPSLCFAPALCTPTSELLASLGATEHLPDTIPKPLGTVNSGPLHEPADGSQQLVIVGLPANS